MILKPTLCLPILLFYKSKIVYIFICNISRSYTVWFNILRFEFMIFYFRRMFLRIQYDRIIVIVQVTRKIG